MKSVMKIIHISLLIGPLHNLVGWYNSAMLCHKLHSGTSRTKELAPVKLDCPLFCGPAWTILYHVNRLCKGAIWPFFMQLYKHSCDVLLHIFVGFIETENAYDHMQVCLHAYDHIHVASLMETCKQPWENYMCLHEHLNFPNFLRCLYHVMEIHMSISTMRLSYIVLVTITMWTGWLGLLELKLLLKIMIIKKLTALQQQAIKLAVFLYVFSK